MTISVFTAARHMAEKSDWTLSNLKLQKLLYLSHMFFLGRTGGEPLISGNFEAWDYGPVHAKLYHHAKIFGSAPVKDIFHSATTLEDGAEKAILDEAFESLGGASAGQLVNATHRQGGAWDKNYIPGVRNCVIPNEEILIEYQELNNGEASNA